MATDRPLSEALPATDRRALLALTGALLAGAAGCLSDDADDSTGAEPDDDSIGTRTDPGTDAGPEDSDGFDGRDVPDFPQLDLVTDPEVDEALLAEQVRGNVAFSLDLLAELRDAASDENLFFSPYSVSVALAMTYAGARGETAAEMADALRYDLEGEGLHAAFGALEAEFARRNEDGEEVEHSFPEEDTDEDGPAFRLATANALWGQEGHGFSEDFLELLEAYYGAGMRLVDFAGDAEAAREEINAWVAEHTEGRIEDLLEEGDVSDLTRLVLTNAIYFLAPWEHQFDPADTEPGTFTGLDGTETEVETMHQTLEVPYAEIDGHQLVELPYANGDSSMVVLLPAEGEFEAFEEALTVDRLATMLEETSVPEVDLALPKFAVESRFSLVEVMQNLGMELAFGGGDFSGMDGSGGLEIGEIVHQSFVEVDEEGTEAAAATAVVMNESAPAERVEVVVDRPFLFYVRDRPTETPLFVGRAVDGETLQAE